MFLDSYHQVAPDANFNHHLTTKNMLEFVISGNVKTQERGDQLEIITTLYGPPPWATKQKFIGERDLDQEQSENLGQYVVDWIHFLRDQNLPVKYLSLHNEGEDFYKWDFQKGTQRFPGFDFNMYWSPGQVNHFLKMMPGRHPA
jgi:hypothetical protein